EVQPSDTDPSRSVIAYTSAIVDGEAKMVQLNDTSFKGGQLGGLLSYRSESLDDTQNALGRLALGIAHQVNSVHADGFDLEGNAATDIFSFKLSEPIPTGAEGEPIPQLSINLVDSGKRTGTDYVVEFSDGNYTARTIRKGPAQVIDDRSSFSVDGIEFSLGAADQAVKGDRWLRQPTRHAAGDFSV